MFYFLAFPVPLIRSLFFSVRSFPEGLDRGRPDCRNGIQSLFLFTRPCRHGRPVDGVILVRTIYRKERIRSWPLLF